MSGELNNSRDIERRIEEKFNKGILGLASNAPDMPESIPDVIESFALGLGIEVAEDLLNKSVTSTLEPEKKTPQEIIEEIKKGVK